MDDTKYVKLNEYERRKFLASLIDILLQDDDLFDIIQKRINTTIMTRRRNADTCHNPHLTISL